MRLGIAIVGGALAAALIYALLRIGQAVTMTDVDPSLVFYSEHAGYVWRSWTAVYAGGGFAFVVWLIAGRAPLRVARVLAWATPIVAIAAAVQGMLVP